MTAGRPSLRRVSFDPDRRFAPVTWAPPERLAPAMTRWSSPVAVGLTVLGLLLLAFELSVVVPRVVSQPGPIGVDFHQYLDHARRWIGGAGFYLPEQLAGPYDVMALKPPLYPPTFLWLIVPFLFLPQVLWWAIPLGIIVGAIAHSQPGPWAWAAIVALLAWPRSYELILFGNPVMWIGAAVALGTIHGWPAVAVLLKPSLLPFALLGARHRLTLLALAAFALVSLPFGAMWLDYLRVIANSHLGWSYSIREIPFVLIPVVAWVGRRRWGVIDPQEA